MKTAILILAAGRSLRMRQPKQLLPFKKTTLLGYVIEQALQVQNTAVFCVLGAYEKQIKPTLTNYKIEIISNPNFKEGLSSSIVVGVTHLLKKEIDSVLILLADQPNISTYYLQQMCACFKQNNTTIIASNYNKNLGVPALFPKKYFTELLKLEGDKGAKKFLNNQLNILKMDFIDLVDIDTEEEFMAIKKLI